MVRVVRSPGGFEDLNSGSYGGEVAGEIYSFDKAPRVSDEETLVVNENNETKRKKTRKKKKPSKATKVAYRKPKKITGGEDITL